MNRKLREAVGRAEVKLTEADGAIQAIQKHLAFSRFENSEPQVTACNGGEIILEYYGSEMSIETAIERMEECGYITPDDFL